MTSAAVRVGLERVARLFLLPLGLLLAALSLGRLFLFLEHRDVFSGFDAASVAASFLTGVRYDLAIATILSIPFFSLLFLPGLARSRTLARVVLCALVLWYSAILMYDVIDILYYGFVQRHLAFEPVDIWRDTALIFKIGFQQYLTETLGLFAFLVLFGLVFLALVRIPALRQAPEDGPARARRLAGETVAFAAFVGLTVVFVRGGFQEEPITAETVFRNQKVELGVLSLNGLYTSFYAFYDKWGNAPSAVARSLGRSGPESLDAIRGFLTDDRMESDPAYPLYRRFRYPDSERRARNVVVFLMESWSSKFVGALGGRIDATPFFDDLSTKGLLLTRCFANGQRSKPGISATLASVPVWKGMVLAEGGLLYQTRLELAGSVFDKLGYDTIFVQGASPGTLEIDLLVRKLGTKRFVTRDDFDESERHEDGVWGVFDEETFLKAHRVFEQTREPFFATVYSLTSHTPYTVPSKEFLFYDSSTPNHDFLNSLRYSDHALSRFFETARNSAYFENTLFVIVADHTEGSSTSGNYSESYAIPCLFYCPGLVAPGRYDGLASQVDIVPTLFDILRISTPHTAWGKSIFASGPRRALLSRDDLFLWLSETRMLLTDLESPLRLFDYRADPARNLLDGGGEEERRVADQLRDELRSYVRFSYDVMTENRIEPVGERDKGSGHVDGGAPRSEGGL